MSPEFDPVREEDYRYEHPRDEALHIMTTNGWANATGGSPLAPTGLYARMTNEAADLPELRGAFDSTFKMLGVEPQDVLGNFIVVEDNEQAVHVVAFQSHRIMLAAYEELRLTYEAWRDGTPS